MNKNSKIAILGSKGMVGKAIVRQLQSDGYTNVLQVSRNEVDFTVQNQVDKWFDTNRPEYVFVTAAKVGGIINNNNHPADFGYENGIIQLNILGCAFKYKVTKLLFLGSACIYPKSAPNPIKEEALLSDYLEPTNEMYALSKIHGLKLCQAYNKQYGCNFISCMPTNLYGIDDNFSNEGGHVLPSVMRRIHDSKIRGDKSVTCFGSGQVYREFLYISDMADACIFLMNNYNENTTINIGSGSEIKIYDLVYKIKNVVGYQGSILCDTSRPDGVLRRILDTSKLFNLGWKPKVSFDDVLKIMYDWFVSTTNKRL